ncbi:GIY-YIG nuclease family protein [Pleomorphomonas carboxyditropha]|uniref:Endonuclease n=1 Tax=Pleomorphomonas carboxyditropha TaxID=2023338 RepID=A0A2G9WQG9_9HYPH|nr:GIY-YIG nuclease family protein [Pleomorphomonas carboxyditropha]PIO96957.1 endonuclease [Pleomorphomonas carboxyditropha]
MNPGWVYIVTNKPQGVLYIGVTSDLEGRIWEHRNAVHRGFTHSYNCTRLVWYEDYGDITDAIYREKRLKTWKRAWKIGLIEEMNPGWNDLFETIMS